MRYILSLLFLSSLSVPLLGQEGKQAVASQPSEPEVRSVSEEVLLDVVVRDKKGHRVDDLKPEDFQIFDNGEPKKITSFRLVHGAEVIGTGGARTQLDPLRQIRLVTMIFQWRVHSFANEAALDRQVRGPGGEGSRRQEGASDNAGSANIRRLARDAALDLLKSELPQSVYIAVMVIDHKLEVLQPFTNDPALLRKAIDHATRSENTDFSEDTETVRKQLEQMASPNASGSPSPQAEVSGTPSLSAKYMAEMLLEVIRTEQSNAMMEPGRTAIYALLDAVKEQYRLPGRKTVLYFAEGFSIPQGVEEPFRQIISVANRSNVSFYTVDARGLTTMSSNQAAIDTLRSAVQSSHDQVTATSDMPVRRDEARVIDTSIESTRANTQSALGELADSTGGALIANTNDLRTPLRKLAEDTQTYYEISYNPEIKTYDGSFRKITIKMASSDLHVQSRSGYIALPPALARGKGLHAFEVPLLAALDGPDLPKMFSFEATAMHFRGRQGEPICELVIDVPLSSMTLQKQGADQSSGHLSYVALVKNKQGEVVKKFQNEIPLTVQAAKLDGFKASHFIYTEHFDLPSGEYTVETAVLDGEGNRISARKSGLTMPPPATTLALSSVTFIRSTKDKGASGEEVDPLVVGTKVISPTLNPVINKADTAALPFYMVIYPDQGALSAPELEMEFSRNGEVLGRGPAQLGQQDKDGRIQLVATVPLAHLEPGDFTIRFIAKQGSETAEETASFKLR